MTCCCVSLSHWSYRNAFSNIVTLFCSVLLDKHKIQRRCLSSSFFKNQNFFFFFSLPAKHQHVCLCEHVNSVVSLLTVSVTSWWLSRLRGHSRSLGCLLLIQPASACSPTQFAIKTKFRALKPEGRWVSAQGTCCLATGGDEVRRVYLSGRGRCDETHVCAVCVCVRVGHMLVFANNGHLLITGYIGYFTLMDIFPSDSLSNCFHS